MDLRRITLVFVMLAACDEKDAITPVDSTDPTDPPIVDSTTPPVDSTDTVDTGTPTDTDTTPPTETGTPHTGDSAVPVCPLPPAPVNWTYLTTPSSEDFAFDALGNLVNIDDGVDALVLTPYAGNPAIVAPYSSPEVAGVVFLPDGRLAMADEGNGALVIIGMDGSKVILNGAMDQPNSITVDQLGQIYVTEYDSIVRVDPVTGVSTPIAELPGLDLDGLTFSPDYLTLYFNYDEDSIIGKVELDASGNVLATTPVVNLPDQFGFELDGMTVDTCGNVYAIATNGVVYRYRTDGTAEILIQLGGVPGMTTSSLHFGSGVGGWERDHLYVINRYGGIFELDIGIEGRSEPHLP